jgi:hypothetical protein
VDRATTFLFGERLDWSSEGKNFMTTENELRRSAIFGGNPSEALLSELFLDRFKAKAWEKLDAFLNAIARTTLPFDLLVQLPGVRHIVTELDGFKPSSSIYYLRSSSSKAG